MHRSVPRRGPGVTTAMFGSRSPISSARADCACFAQALRSRRRASPTSAHPLARKCEALRRRHCAARTPPVRPASRSIAPMSADARASARPDAQRPAPYGSSSRQLGAGSLGSDLRLGAAAPSPTTSASRPCTAAPRRTPPPACRSPSTAEPAQPISFPLLSCPRLCRLTRPVGRTGSVLRIPFFLRARSRSR